MNLLSIPFLCVGHKDLLASCPELMGLCLLPLIVDGLNQFICFCIQLRICGATFLQLYQNIRILLAQQGDEQFAASSIGIQNSPNGNALKTRLEVAPTPVRVPRPPIGQTRPSLSAAFPCGPCPRPLPSATPPFGRASAKRGAI